MTQPGAVSFACPSWLLGWKNMKANNVECPWWLDGLSGRLRSQLTAAMHCGNFQAHHKTQGLPVNPAKAGVWLRFPWAGTRERGCSLPQHHPLHPLCQTPASLSGARLVPEKLPLMTSLWCPHHVICLC